MMRYGSVCSGIEAATAAWHPLGWEPAWFAEVEPFPCAVLAHHYPAVPNLGDITAPDFTERAKGHGSIDVLVGGTPCQSFSVAGLRGGMDDPRGNLALVFLAIADRLRPAWVVWENVPGVLSSASGEPESAPPDRVGVGPGERVVDTVEYDEGGDFACFATALAQLGYGWAYRVLDAQHFGVPQRRRRVFVVGYLGDWRRAAAVLFERDCLSGNPAPSRAAGARTADSLTVGANQYSGFNGEPGEPVEAAGVATGVTARQGKGPDSDCTTTLVVNTLKAYSGRNQIDANYLQTAGTLPADYGKQGGNGMGEMAGGLIVGPMTCNGDQHRGFRDAYGLVAHSLRADGFDASEDGTGRGTPIIPIDLRQASRGEKITNNRAHGSGGAPGHGVGHAGDPAFTISERGQAVAFAQNQRGELRESDVAPQLTCGGGKPGEGYGAASPGSAVRRLTPRECERLQGFPDDFTALPGAKDGPRYRALGNSMAVPVMAWIGRRIDLVRAVLDDAVAVDGRAA